MFKDWNQIAKDCAQGIGTPQVVATLKCIPAVFSNVLNALLVFVGLISLAIFILGGIRFMNSAGDPKKLEGARHTFLYGIIGLTIIILSFLIINVISYITGVECIEFGQLKFSCQ